MLRARVREDYIEEKFEYEYKRSEFGQMPKVSIVVNSTSQFYPYRLSVHLNDGSAVYLSNGQQRYGVVSAANPAKTYAFYTSEMEELEGESKGILHNVKIFVD